MWYEWALITLHTGGTTYSTWQPQKQENTAGIIPNILYFSGYKRSLQTHFTLTDILRSTENSAWADSSSVLSVTNVFTCRENENTVMFPTGCVGWFPKRRFPAGFQCEWALMCFISLSKTIQCQEWMILSVLINISAFPSTRHIHNGSLSDPSVLHYKVSPLSHRTRGSHCETITSFWLLTNRLWRTRNTTCSGQFIQGFYCHRLLLTLNCFSAHNQQTLLRGSYKDCV